MQAVNAPCALDAIDEPSANNRDAIGMQSQCNRETIARHIGVVLSAPR